VKRWLPLICLCMINCTKQPSCDASDNPPFFISQDTIVGHHLLSNVLPGGSELKRVEAYYIVVRNDTSDFNLKLTESFTGRIGGEVRFKDTKTFASQWLELQKIFPYAFDYFNARPEKFQIIFVSRLMTMGDLAVDVTNEYNRIYGTNDVKLSHAKVTNLILHSQLTNKWNDLLQPFSLQVDTVFAEKIFFADKKELYGSNKMEIDSTQVPDRILDCTLWFRLKRKKVFSS
jgi:hypothetical protein